MSLSYRETNGTSSQMTSSGNGNQTRSGPFGDDEEDALEFVAATHIRDDQSALSDDFSARGSVASTVRQDDPSMRLEQ